MTASIRFSVLAMPDIFLDHSLQAGEPDKFVQSLRWTAPRGTRMRATQWLNLGGNAYNFGLHMARLGCAVTMVSATSTTVLEMVRRETRGLRFSTDFVETDNDPSLTVALEFRDSRGSRALNINHPGSLNGFGPDRFPTKLERRKYDLVSVFNFTNNMLGPQLASHVFSRMKGLKLMDLPDAASGFSDREGLKSAIELCDVISATPEEVVSAAKLLKLSRTSGVRSAAVALSSMGPRMGIHSASDSIEVCEGKAVVHRSKPMPLPSTTGAGDCWTAAFALSLLRGEKPSARLEFSSGYATEMLLKRAQAPE